MIAPSTNSIPASSLSEQATGPSVVASSPSPTAVCAAQLQAGQAAASISPSAGPPPAPSTSATQDIDIWTSAYEVVENREPELMTDYASHLAYIQDVVKQLLGEREKKQWRLPLLGNNVIIRKQAERLAKVLLWADPVVKRAVSTQPYAALAWSSVSILLPLLTSAATPDVAMLKGFNSISDVQVYWAIFEETYLSSSHRHHYENLIEPLAKLYSYIIEYQARAICHLSKTQLSRGWQNVAGENDWAEKASEIEALSEARSSLISHDNENEIRERWGRQLREIQESSAILKEIRQVLDETQRQTQGNYEDKAEKDLLHDLASDYEGYKDFNRLRVQGTCEWFFNDEKFCKWRDSNTSGLLWLSAGPGCGKSILSRALIDERRLSLNVTTSTVCHFFFKDGYEDRMYSVNALCAVLHQLFSRDPSGALIKLALPAHKNYGKSLIRNLSGLWNILLDCAKSPHAGEIVCILDALDECEQQSRLQLISKLKDFYCQPQGSSALSSKLSFLITSRPYPEIERNFGGFSTTEYLHFDGDKKSVAITREIDLVIDDHVSQTIGNFTADDQLEISKRLKTMENRTYLWLYVIFETIKEDPSRHGKRSSIEKLLNNIPSKLSEAYEKILGRSRCQEETQHLLEIILAAARPLTLDEANVALTLALAEEDFTSHSALENDLWPKNNFESIVKGLSGLFISVHDSKLFFIHQTAREFLIDPSGRGTWEGRLSMSKSSRTISRACFKFLMLPDLRASVKDADFWDDDDYDLNDPNHVTLKQLPPFFCYAADHWPSHFLSQGPTDIDQSLKDARTLCNRHQAWVWVTASGWTPQVVENILTEEHIDVNTEDKSSTLALKSSRSALSAACLGGKSDVVTLLLDKGANVNSYHKLHATALFTALVYGHQDIVPILLEKGADVNIIGEHHGTALYIASHLGNPDIVLSILERGADINYNHKWHGTALYRACRSGHPKVVKILLENGANVNIIGNKGYGSALLAASTLNHPDIVIDLLKKGADTDYNNQKYGTALQMASGRGWQNIVELLLAHGANPNTRGTQDGSSPIQVASFYGHQGAVEELLKHGADVNFPDQRGNTALHAAARQDHREIVSMLLRCGADVTLKGELYGTALNAATEAGHTEIIEMLAKRGAKV
ncbi:hypothetical protein N7519_009338 [Penicillium mononematosum]|uniref:uncharacterized protein n=1 Tax=Penicillium mononematosum TaxID=268346 RepID=UPI002546D02D|nr:uncharacterized protein N7519_009338 [Penicillium mononematosum]KAJ6178877.1 hypothetical protein N7519_009338 [Penicillium mononematosum]